MSLTGSLTAGTFLQECWQKTPRLLPGACLDVTPRLTADDAAWLATQPDVESRLITTARNDDCPTYRVEQGPFEEQRLTSLPATDWTLLVHDVEKHLPELRSWVTWVDVVPDWRVDDLMISVAAPGGSVGPHVDNYDVFLCQTGGIREWRLCALDKAIVDSSSQDLELLQPFADFQRLISHDGDVLYLPPGQPHWGIASEFCMTYSVGMRAPSRGELSVALDRVRESEQDSATNSRDALPPLEANRLYSDPDLSQLEFSPGRIDEKTLVRIREQALLDSALDDRLLVTALGCAVTDPKMWLAPDGMTAERATQMMNRTRQQDPLHCHGMARLAYFASATIRLLFLNGHHRAVSGKQIEGIEWLCRNRRILRHQIDDELLNWLLQHGGLDI